MLVAVQWWYKNSDSCGPIAGQFLPTRCVGDQTGRMSGLEDEPTSQDIQAVDHKLAAVIPVKGVTSGATNTSDPHMLEDQLPKRPPALLADVAVPPHSWVEKAFPHMRYAVRGLSQWGFLSGKYSPDTPLSAEGIACR